MLRVRWGGGHCYRVRELAAPTQRLPAATLITMAVYEYNLNRICFLSVGEACICGRRLHSDSLTTMHAHSAEVDSQFTAD